MLTWPASMMLLLALLPSLPHDVRASAVRARPAATIARKRTPRPPGTLARYQRRTTGPKQVVLSRSVGPQRDEGGFEVEPPMHAGAHRDTVGWRHRFDEPVEHEPRGQDLVEQHAHRDPPERHLPPAAQPVEQGIDA